ncbi:iron ABC transporter permease, partial [Escherichia coli]|nr:iron ABC transporter permease [Escherichia coli]
MTSEPMITAEKAAIQADDNVKQHYQTMLRRRLTWIVVIIAAILLSLVIDFTLGPSGLSLERLWQTLITPESVDAGTRVIVWDIRLP